MRSSKQRVLFAFFVLFALTVNLPAQDKAPVPDVQAIKEEVARLLQTRDVGDLANELARQKSSRIPDLLKKIIVFARAGHRARVLETFRQIVAAEDFEIYKSSLFYPLQEAAGKDDLAARRFFYEHIALGGDEHVESFTQLWKKTGDARELEKWLAARAAQNFTWWQELVRLKQSLGTAEEAFAELEGKIRANPNDRHLIEWYLRSVGENRSVAWLAEAVPAESAWDAYELATHLSRREPRLAAKLFERSLGLPFTEKDRENFGWFLARSFSVAPPIKNPEKQLRYWTKKALAEIYRKTGQPQRAQPLVEELTAMETSDILRDEVFALAGAVQAASGERVVEARVLQAEAQNQNSPQYWIERAQYYIGRGEAESAWQTFEQALRKFPYQPNGSNAPRLQILRSLVLFGENARREETRKAFSREFARAARDELYLFELGRIAGDDFEDLLGEIFFNNELLPRVLAARPKWRDAERAFIVEVMDTDEWDPANRQRVWDQLAALARRDLKNRAFALAQAMTSRSQTGKAIELFEELLKIAPADFEGDANYNREYVQKELFDAYLAAGDWQSAEKMFRGGFDYWKDSLGRIALAAARRGETGDAVRLWKMNAARDRQNFWHLDELAKTDARADLRRFYLEMKKRDPLSDAPDKALRILQ